jgi:copper resistance protein C
MEDRTTTAKSHPLASFPGWGIAAAIALVAFAMLPGSASAHANYESSVPSDGEVVADSPERVDVYYGQEVARSGGLPTMFVANQSGDVIADEPVLDDDDRTHISIDLPPALPDGRYTVVWHTISDEDAEEAQGAFHFYVGTGPEPTPDENETPGGTATPVVTTPADNGDEADDDSGVPAWTLALAAIGGLVVGGGGVALARRRGA